MPPSLILLPFHNRFEYALALPTIDYGRHAQPLQLLFYDCQPDMLPHSDRTEIV